MTSSDASSLARPGNDECVAALLLTIDPPLAASVMRGFCAAQLERVTAAMNRLRDTRLAGSMIQDALLRVMRELHDTAERAPSPEDEIDDLDISAARQRFAIFEALSPEDLANLLAREHPQIAAVFLAHLDRRKAAGVVRHMPQHRRSDQLYRIATLDRTPHDVVERILDVMVLKVEQLGLTAHHHEPVGWVKAAAEILNHLGGAESAILEAIGESNDMIAESIREEMFTFDDLASLDNMSVQRVLRRVDSKSLATALKSAPPNVEATLFDNLSKRAAEAVIDRRDALGALPMSAILDARQEIMRQVREMADRGEVARVVSAEEPGVI